MDPASLLLLGLMIVAFYFVLIRPQQRRLKQHQALVQSLSPGDEVVTIGGIYGTVEDVEDATILLRISPGTTVRFARQAISRKISPDTELSEPMQAADEES